MFNRGSGSGIESKRTDESFYSGIVVKNDDPLKLNRVKVYIPMLSNQPFDDWFEKYEEIKQKVTADPTLKDFDERKIMLFFDGDMDYAHLASKLNLPTVNTEDATKIGMAYKNLDVKGVYNLRGLIQNYKFFPESMIQKYDTNELGVLSSIFTE